MLITDISQASLDAFWSREPGKVRSNLIILSNMGTMYGEDMVL